MRNLRRSFSVTGISYNRKKWVVEEGSFVQTDSSSVKDGGDKDTCFISRLDFLKRAGEGAPFDPDISESAYNPNNGLELS